MTGTIKIVLFSISIILLSAICALAGPLPDTDHTRGYMVSYGSANTTREQNLDSDIKLIPTVRAGQGSASNAGIKVTVDEGLPDLVAVTFWTKSDSILEGEQFWIKSEVSNSGTEIAGPSHVKLYLSRDNDFDVSDDYYVGEKAVGSLAPGENETTRLDFTMPDIGSGTYSVWVVIVMDCRDAV